MTFAESINSYLMTLELDQVDAFKESTQLWVSNHLVIEHVHNLLEADAVSANKGAMIIFCRAVKDNTAGIRGFATMLAVTT